MWRPSRGLQIKFCTDINCWMAGLFDTGVHDRIPERKERFFCCWLIVCQTPCSFLRPCFPVKIKTPNQTQSAGETYPTCIIYRKLGRVRYGGQVLLIAERTA